MTVSEEQKRNDDENDEWLGLVIPVKENVGKKQKILQERGNS